MKRSALSGFAIFLLKCWAFPELAGAQAAPEIVVSGARPARDSEEIELNAAQARREPGTQNDPAKVIENLPGVARTAFGADELVLWGAAPEDSRVYVDGVEIPRLFHGSGIRSTVNGDLLQSVSLTPGAYGASYGRAIGGMVRLETRDITREGVHGTLDLSTLDASVIVSAAPTERVQIQAAVRYGLVESTVSAFTSRDIRQFYDVPRYGDYQAKAEVALRESETLALVLLGSRDALTRSVGDSDPPRARTLDTTDGFDRVYLRYRRRYEDGSDVEVVPWLGLDTDRSNASYGPTAALLDERSVRFGLRAEHRSLLAPGATMRLGLDSSASASRERRIGSLTIPPREGDISVFGEPPGDDSTYDDFRALILAVSPYAAFDWKIGPVSLSPGLRGTAYLIEASRLTPRIGQTPSIGQSALAPELEPRLALGLRLSRRVSFHAAAGRYTQAPAPADLSAVFGTPTLGPETAEHLSAGETVELNETLSAHVTGFYRTLSNLAVRDPSPTPRLAHALISSGTGDSYGLEIAIRQKPWHGFSGSLAYTISRSERKATPDSATRSFDYDEPNVLTLVLGQRLAEWSLGTRFRYTTGAPRTPVIGALFDERDDRFEPIFGPQNSSRLPDFWQLDVRVDRRFELRAARLSAYLELLNVTNRANAEEWAYSADFSHRAAITGLPFFAVLGARLEL